MAGVGYWLLAIGYWATTGCVISGGKRRKTRRSMRKRRKTRRSSRGNKKTRKRKRKNTINVLRAAIEAKKKSKELSNATSSNHINASQLEQGATNTGGKKTRRNKRTRKSKKSRRSRKGRKSRSRTRR